VPGDAHGCLDIGLDEAAEFIDFPGAAADEQHRCTLHEGSIAADRIAEGETNYFLWVQLWV
jgi:hypothetical protein